MSRDNWTTTDEANFQALQARRDAVTEARMSELLRVSKNLQLRSYQECVAILKRDAYAFRKALEPFDNGPPPDAAAPRLPLAIAGLGLTANDVVHVDPIERAAQGVREEIIDATKPGYRFTRTQESEAEQVHLRD